MRPYHAILRSEITDRGGHWVMDMGGQWNLEIRVLMQQFNQNTKCVAV